jgi:hypothetical protein
MLEIKYVLCRPRGGLNDMLCEIEKSRMYAEHHLGVCAKIFACNRVLQATQHYSNINPF